MKRFTAVQAFALSVVALLVVGVVAVRVVDRLAPVAAPVAGGAPATGAVAGPVTSDMKGASDAAAWLVRERMERERAGDWDLLRRMKGADIVVVRGVYDHLEQVLQALDLPFRSVAPHEVGTTSLEGRRMVMINCPGDLTEEGIASVRRFVEEGGFLFTTDWALKNVIEPAFPGTVRWNQVNTADDVVAVRVTDPDNPFLRHVSDGATTPRWWLEGASYPIEILDPERVEVLVASAEMKQRYGEGSIAVSFRAGKGTVLHMVSHFYLQRTETRTAADQQAGSSVAEAMGFGQEALKQAPGGMAGAPAAEVQAQYSNQQMITNFMMESVAPSGPGGK